MYEHQRSSVRNVTKVMRSRGCTFSYRVLHEWLKEKGFLHPQGSLKGHGRVGKPVRQKPCVICQEMFMPGSSGHLYCKTCIPNSMAWHHFKHYGLTHQRFNELLKLQNGSCAGCHKELVLKQAGTCRSKVLFVDHCHETGVVRGLLCMHCNSALGFANDPVILRRLATYLDQALTQ